MDKNNKDYLYRLINLIVSVTRKNNIIDTESFKYYFRVNKKNYNKVETSQENPTRYFPTICTHTGTYNVINQTAAMHSVINESLTTRINVYPASGNHNTMDHTSTTVCPKKE